MIPIVSIGNAFSFFFCVIAAAKLYFSYKKTKDRRIGNFFKFYFFIGIFFGLLATPGIIFHNPVVIEFVSLELGLFFLYLSVAYFVSISFDILGWHRLRDAIFLIILIIAFGVFVINTMTLEPAIRHVRENFVSWEDNRGVLVNIITGLVAAGGAFMSTIFFWINAYQSAQKYISHRSFLIGLGMFILGAAAIFNYWIGASPAIMAASIIASLLVISGLLTILLGIYHHHEEDIIRGVEWSSDQKI